MQNARKALTLSIIIPAFNEENYLRECLESIAKQEEMPEEVIVVDNNSTDASAEIAKSFDFVTLLHEPKQGVTYARDRGFNAAGSDIIGRIDADTRLAPDWVSDVKQLFKKHEIVAVSGPTGFYDLPLRDFSLFVTKVVRTALYYLGRKEDRYLFGSNMALRRSAWQAVAGQVCHTRGIHEDNDLAIHLIEANLPVRYSNELIADISVRRASASPKQAIKYAFMEYKTFRKHHIFSFSAFLAGIILILLYPLMWFLHRVYDPEKRCFSIKRLFAFRSDRRRLPMG